LRLAGKAVAILSGERVALNFLRHLSGIATVTRKFVDIAGTDAKISATPETTPGLRLLDVYAMEMGGGIAYRGNAIRLNRNHIALAGGVKAALDQAHAFVSSQMNPPEMTAYEAVGAVPSNGEASSLSVQIEVRSESELREALSAGVEWVSLQAMGLSEARECVSIAREMRPDCVVEISGGITLENAHRYVESGADYLSPSGLIGSVPKAEVRLLVENQ
jgi:nicotinate-nucleotide pyrophosphorylase (carboxylating)